MTPETTATNEAQARGAGEAVPILYTNWRGETAVRRIVPLSLKHDSSEWHAAPQWLLTAFDHDKEVWRDFAFAGIRAWGQEAVDAATAPATSGSVVVPDQSKRAFTLGQRVEKISGSSWLGHVVGTYSTALTPIGYAVESEREPGSVQIYPEAALRAVGGPAALAAPERVEGDDLAGLSAAAPKGPWTVTYDEIGEGPDRRPVALLESADERIIAVDEEPDALECRSPVLEFAAALETAYRSGALIPATPTVGGTGECVRHVKRGTEYEVLYRGVEMQVALLSPVIVEPTGHTEHARALSKGRSLVIYRGADGKTWAREESEFDDGRFERIAAPPPSGLSQAAEDGTHKIIEAADTPGGIGPGDLALTIQWPDGSETVEHVSEQAAAALGYRYPDEAPARAAAPGGQTGEAKVVALSLNEVASLASVATQTVIAIMRKPTPAERREAFYEAYSRADWMQQGALYGAVATLLARCEEIPKAKPTEGVQ